MTASGGQLFQRKDIARWSRNIFETLRDQRQWHTPPDPEAAQLGIRGWHSRGYLLHFDLPA